MYLGCYLFEGKDKLSLTSVTSGLKHQMGRSAGRASHSKLANLETESWRAGIRLLTSQVNWAAGGERGEQQGCPICLHQSSSVLSASPDPVQLFSANISEREGPQAPECPALKGP
jgi:hypothetical protein